MMLIALSAVSSASSYAAQQHDLFMVERGIATLNLENVIHLAQTSCALLEKFPRLING